MPQAKLWVAELLISEWTAAKIAGRHHLTPSAVRDAIVCVVGLQYVWHSDAERGLRVIVSTSVEEQTVRVVLYPAQHHPMGDVYHLGSAYPL